MPGPMEPIGASNRPDLFGDGGGAPPTGGDAPPLPVEGVDDGGGDDDMVELPADIRQAAVEAKRAEESGKVISNCAELPICILP